MIRSLREPSLADPSVSIRALRLHRFLLRAALAGAHIFAWLFIFQYVYLVEPSIAQAFARTALLYALSQIVTCLVTPYAALSLRLGTRRSLIFATLALSCAFFLLGAAFEGIWSFAYLPAAIVIFAMLLGVYRALYWVPYEVEANAEGEHHRASPVAEFCIALVPMVGGLFIAAVFTGPVWILYIGAGVTLISAVPLLYLRDIHEGFSWSYRETFARLFHVPDRALAAQAFCEGFSGAALLFFWPLAVFFILGWSYGLLGIVLSLTFLIAILLRLVVRAVIRRMRLHESVLLNVVLAMTPWIARLVVATPLGVVSVDSYFYTTAPRRLGVDALSFEQAADGATFVDEYTALKEIALGLGRIAACLFGAAVSLSISLPVAFLAVFIVAAVASGASVLLR